MSPFIVELGFLNFAKAISKSRPYAYAAFPRGDVAGVISDLEARAHLAARYSGRLEASAGERERSASAERTIVNFAGGQSPPQQGDSPGEGYSFDFGWTVVRSGKQEPMQASQLVLVSVPAYLDELKLEVTHGWLDADVFVPEAVWKNPREVRERLLRQIQTRSISIPIPPDYEAMDTLVDPELWRQRPTIEKGEDDETPMYAVRAGQQAKLLITGTRLWRSAVVMIGGQPANKISGDARHARHPRDVR